MIHFDTSRSTITTTPPSKLALRVPRLSVSLLRAVALQPLAQGSLEKLLTYRSVSDSNACRPEIKAVLRVLEYETE